MRKKLRKRWAGLLCAVAAALLMAPNVQAAEEEFELRDLEEGEVRLVGEDVLHEGAVRTTFYVQVDGKAGRTYQEGKTTGGDLPKTGDSGPELEPVLIAALAFGGGYLLCDGYEDKRMA